MQYAQIPESQGFSGEARRESAILPINADGKPTSTDFAIADRGGARAFIKANLPLKPAPGLPGIRIHTATPESGLRKLAAFHADHAWRWVPQLQVGAA